MSIDCDKFILGAPPRTGIRWFCEAWRKVGESTFYQQGEIYKPSLIGSKLNVSLIRHPYSWLKSLYFNLPEIRGRQVKQQMHGELKLIVDLAYTSCTFFDFVARVSSVPGCIGRMFDSYPANSVLRLEDFPDSAVSLFELMEAEGAPCFYKVHNVRVPNPGLPVNEFLKDEKQLKQLIIKTEPELCDRYEYY